MFGRVDRDRPLRHLGVEIPRDALPLFVGAFAGLTKEVDGFLAAQRLAVLAEWIVDVVVEVAHADQHRGRVVDWHGPTGQTHAGEGLLLRALLPDGAGLGQVRQDDVVHPHPGEVADPTRCNVDHAERRLAKFGHRQFAPGRGKLLEADPGMQKHPVRGVHDVLEDLQPVARVGQRVRDRPVAG